MSCEVEESYVSVVCATCLEAQFTYTNTQAHVLHIEDVQGACDVTACATSSNSVVKSVSKQEKERQRKERQKQRKWVELESTLQNALAGLSLQVLRWVHTSILHTWLPCMMM